MKIKMILLSTALLSPWTLMLQAAQPLVEESSLIRAEAKPAEGEALVQLAILLDTSGSMSGLIDQAKTQLWKLVNEFISAKQEGKTPVVQVALYEYGKTTLSAEEHWIRQIQPLTRDLDKISEELFALKTNGGEEYCGAVIQRATLDLAWDPSPKVYKAIFIAGNEPFTQGPVSSDKSCRAAIAKGIIVNTIHCGSEAQGLAEHWNRGALLADGKYMVIDQNRAVAHIEAPQDKEIVKLNEKLNQTYIGYGAAAPAAVATQRAQDANALANAAVGSEVQRVVSKASANYWNSRWDLVDASKQKDFDIAKMKEQDLPLEMRKMTVEERKTFVAAKAVERQEIQKKVLELSREREAYVAKKQQAAGEGETLDKVITQALREQAAKKGVKWEK